tara:strand:+ start:740 stop:1363 length:624 start_codon:yes stop_codon:yes gene_type:complete
MNDISIAIFDNKIFFQIISEIKLFSQFKIKHYEDFELCIKEASKENQLAVFFNQSVNKLKKNNLSVLLISKNLPKSDKLPEGTLEHLRMPFTIIEFKKKIISLAVKAKFKKNSLINLSNYIIDKNERKIRKDGLELQLSEKEIDFLILFSKSKNPISRNMVLKKVWNYSIESETHTVETHIHRLRKKILEKFDDNNFIKNNNKGYYI